ncbi:hypothetical protein [Nonomuraea sp. NEAU-A123]|uniref:hypothetical protein n=1 Tax=Nonomuraea sp. NEAU-A123 TaxID=2839649 RepID=UPI001BE45215|nr:hypothetical protein [Nonomuraea sp. NEAU-A123]MBT2228393.1 hypothetical protein [Nonomuraea sp. NEAU-A123]
MKHLTKKLLVGLAAATLAGSGVVAGAAVTALPAFANAQIGALFDGFGKGIEEDTALANAEAAARQNALNNGFTDCSVFESVASQDARSHVWFAVVTVRCEDVSR